MQNFIISEFKEYPGQTVEFICLKHNLRSLVQVDSSSRRSCVRQLREFAKKHNWFISRSDFRYRFINGEAFFDSVDEKEGGEIFYHYFLSNDSFKVDEWNPASLGRLMGYPSCCVSNYVKNMDSGINVFNQMSISKDSEFVWLINPFVNFLSNRYLINHIPCSLSCKKTLNLAKKISRIIKVMYPEFYKQIYEVSCLPILVFRDNGPYDMNEKIDMIFLNQIDDNLFEIKYNMINSKTYFSGLLKNANKILIIQDEIKLYKNSLLLSSYNKNDLGAFLLMPVDLKKS